MNSFRPAKGATVSLAVAATTGRIKITLQDGPCQVLVHNAGTALAWFDFGDSTVTTTAATGTPIPGGAYRVFSAPKPYNDGLYAAIIAVGATGSVYFTPGTGI